MNLIAQRLTAQQGKALLSAFYTAWGPEQMLASYGWRQIPQALMRGERMYAFMDPDVGEEFVGWGSLLLNTRDADDEEASLSVGVFPAYQRRGYRRAIIEFLSAKAARLGADRVHQVVLKTNAAHYARMRRECQDPGSPWVYAGDVWYPPPGYGYFVRSLREGGRARDGSGEGRGTGAPGA
jgi:GNAT superfamily N-acetyltransferase